MAEKDLHDPEKENLETVCVEAEVSNFAVKLGEEVGKKYTVYVYKMIKDEEEGVRKSFQKKYIGIEPDPAEIAEKYRGGKYLLQFIWYIKGSQKSRSFVLYVDNDVFPPIPKNNTLMPFQYPGGSSLSETMQLQLATMSMITEVMKSAYSAGNNRQENVRADPFDTMESSMELMENSFKRAMQINNTVMERLLTRKMETQFGLGNDGGNGAPEEDQPALVAKYTPLIREVVDGVKTLFSLFGEIPKQAIQKVKENDKFKMLLNDPKALVVVGSALRKEFGDAKAGKVMESFGVKMVPRPRQPVSQTPEMGSFTDVKPSQSADPVLSVSGQGVAAPAAVKGPGKGKKTKSGGGV
jgi:hypothetical protein